MPRRGDRHNPRQDDDLKADFEANERANSPTRAHEWRDPEMDEAAGFSRRGAVMRDAVTDEEERTEEAVQRDLEEVRRRRRELFPTQAEPLAPESPLPAGFFHGAPGGEITELLEREAHLVLELARLQRAEGVGPDSGLREQEETARRVLDRIKAERL